MENLKFYDKEHEEFYKDYTEGKGLDCYNKSLLYLLGLTEETRKHSKQIYNAERREIEFETLNEAWQTGTSAIICRLAFNLFNGFTGIEEGEATRYAVDSIFCRTEFAPYFYEAIKIRFEIIK